MHLPLPEGESVVAVLQVTGCSVIWEVGRGGALKMNPGSYFDMMKAML